MMKVLKVRRMEVCFIMVQEFMHTLDLFIPDKRLYYDPRLVQCFWFILTKFSVFRGDL